MTTGGARLGRAVLTVIVLVAAVLAGSSAARGQEGADGAFSVTNGNDTGPGSYRQALLDASAEDGDDVVTFGASLSITLQVDAAYTGDDQLRLVGNGSTIDGNGHQILGAASASRVRVEDLTMRGGAADDGGAIQAGADVDIDGSELTDNTATETAGGDASGGAVDAAGTVTVTDSTLSGNSATADPGSAYGGAIDANHATVTNSTLRANTAQGTARAYGGAVTTYQTTTAVGSTFEGNRALSSLTNVVSWQGGGAIDARQGLVNVTDSTFTENEVLGGGGGAIRAHYSVNVTGSTFDRNRAETNFGGGAIKSYQGVITVTNSTLVGNVEVGGAVNSGGGAIREDFGSVVLRHATLVANSAAVSAQVSGSLTTYGSVFADAQGGGDSCYAPIVTSNGYNYATDDTCNLIGTGDVEDGADPQLFPLGEYGGPTRTRPPVAGSPLIDAIPNAACDGAITTDQRGWPRPDVPGGACDVGAAEGTVVPSFSDVPVFHPFFVDIEWMAAEGISTGYADGTYKPAAVVTRQAMSAFMYRLAGEPAFSPPGAASFSDVPTDHTFFEEVEWMADVGVTTGYADGTYKPAAPVSRQAMSAFLYRLADPSGFTAPGSPSFSDVPLVHPFFDEVEWMASEAITTGYADGTFKPGAAVSRQAMSAFMHRLADGPGVGI